MKPGDYQMSIFLLYVPYSIDVLFYVEESMDLNGCDIHRDHIISRMFVTAG